MQYVLRDKWLYIEIASLFYRTVQDLMDDLIPSRKMQHLCITNGWICMDEIKVKRETVLNGKTLSILIYPSEEKYARVADDHIDIVYEDELVVIVNKKPGILVHSDTDQITLNDMVRSCFAAKSGYALNPVHRLDKETGGLIMYSKSAVFQPLLDQYLEKKEIRRTYLAFVKGKIDKGEKFSIDEPIGRDRHSSNKMVVYKNGQKAQTKVESLGYKNGITTLRCTLQTGRTHQIRVHLSYKGYPIINDPLYGVNFDKVSRMGLVASEMVFYHPLKEENIRISVDIDDELKQLMLK